MLYLGDIFGVYLGLREGLVHILSVEPCKGVETVGQELDQVVSDLEHSVLVSSRGLIEA